MNSICYLIEHKKNIIKSYNMKKFNSVKVNCQEQDNTFIFIGSIFNNNLQIKYNDNSLREIIFKYYTMLDSEVECKKTIDLLYKRLKLKFYTQDFSFIYRGVNYITLYDNCYKVKFYMQDSYGEFINPITLNNNEIKKIILHELDIITSDDISL